MTYALLMLIGAGCNETEINKNPLAAGATSLDPDILVEPDTLSFDMLTPGQTAIKTFTITNTGADTLDVSDLRITGTSAFALTDFGGPFHLEFEETRTLTVQFTPANPQDAGEITIYSNDPGDPATLVSLFGEAAVPQLLVSPNPYSFGKVPLDCTATGTLTLQNIGGATLTIENITSTSGLFPITQPTSMSLEPGEITTLDVSVTPTEEKDYTAEIWVTSNNVFGPLGTLVGATGTTDGTVRDEFIQGDGPWTRTDMMVYVDQSCSMEDDQENLGQNFSLFTDALGQLALDWQIMVVTDDTGCHNGNILTDEMSTAEREFKTYVQGEGGRYTESGLTVADKSLQNLGTGQCNEGFLRDESKTMLILISDEPEQSLSPWSEMVTSIRENAPNASITSIVGDVPYGCDTANAGTGYYEASIATGGAFLSICSPNWGDYFQAIAELAATGKTDTFVLTSRPDPTTIVVTVDGNVVTSGWTYDSIGNAIMFEESAMPGSNARIYVDYGLMADCAG